MKGHPTVLYKSQTGRWRVEYSTGHRRSVDRIASEYIDQLRAALEETTGMLVCLELTDAATRARKALNPPRHYPNQ